MRRKRYQGRASSFSSGHDVMNQQARFDYNLAFSRNIGWLTAAEQETLRRKRVAIAGLGGVGGVHMLTLTRLGIGGFNISAFDEFDVPNFNRQAGAMMGQDIVRWVEANI